MNTLNNPNLDLNNFQNKFKNKNIKRMEKNKNSVKSKNVCVKNVNQFMNKSNVY